MPAEKNWTKSLVWVRLPALPLQFWTLDYFKAIGNFLGEFLEADLSFEETKQRKVARILVNLNVREGLGEEIDLSWGSLLIHKFWIMKTFRLDVVGAISMGTW
jgi:hypothetical protein